MKAKENDLKSKMKTLFPEDVEMVCISKNDYDRLYGDLTYENIELKDRINKAIEYIKEQTKGYQDDFDRVEEESWLYDLKITLNILKGDNK